MKKEQKAKQIRDEIDEAKVKAQGKIKSHHLTRITGSRNPCEYVVCTDGTEIAYDKAEEKLLIRALFKEVQKKEGKKSKAQV